MEQDQPAPSKGTSELTTVMSFGFFRLQAKKLHQHPNGRYCIITHRDGQEWIVEKVWPDGDLMTLVKVGLHRHPSKQITSLNYCDYRITEGPFDEDGNEYEISTRFSDE